MKGWLTLEICVYMPLLTIYMAISWMLWLTPRFWLYLHSSLVLALTTPPLPPSSNRKLASRSSAHRSVALAWSKRRRRACGPVGYVRTQTLTGLHLDSLFRRPACSQRSATCDIRCSLGRKLL